MSSNFHKLPPLFVGGPFIRLNFTVLDHPEYGQAEFLGDIPLLLPFRGYTRQEVLPDVHLVDKAAKELIALGRALWADEEDETIYARLVDTTFAAALMGGIRAGETHFMAWVKTLTIIMFMDDEMDSEGGARDMGLIYKQIAEMCGETNSLLDQPLPALTLKMARVQAQVEKLQADLHDVPAFREKFDVALRHELYLFFASHVVQTDLKKHGQVFSRSNTRDLLRHASGWNMGVEMLLILLDVCIPPSVREEVAFAIAQNNLSDIGMLANSLFGLPRDLRLGQQDSSIMQDVKGGRMPLLPAIEKTYMDLLDAMQDFKLATDLLLRAHDGEQDVAKYVQIVREYVDGILYGYKFWERYGISDKVTLFEK